MSKLSEEFDRLEVALAAFNRIAAVRLEKLGICGEPLYHLQMNPTVVECLVPSNGELFFSRIGGRKLEEFDVLIKELCGE